MRAAGMQERGDAEPKSGMSDVGVEAVGVGKEAHQAGVGGCAQYGEAPRDGGKVCAMSVAIPGREVGRAIRR